jgi:hypothetical protein
MSAQALKIDIACRFLYTISTRKFYRLNSRALKEFLIATIANDPAKKDMVTGQAIIDMQKKE